MEKKQNVPALRFPEFSGEWKRKKLLDVLDINSGQDYKALGAGTIPVYGTGGYMLSVDRALSYEKDAIGIGRKGTIDNPFILKAPFWTVDTLFYAIPKEEYDLDFILGIFKNVDWRSKDESTGVPSLSKVAIGKTIAYIPFFMEQQKIGGFIARLNRQEQLFQNKIQKLQQFQQAMLAKLFPREGAAEPELRFRGFSGAWKKRKVKDILIERNEQAPKSEEYPLKAFIANEGIVDKGKRYDRSALVTDTEAKLYKKTQYGDFIYSSNNLETGSIGLNKYGNASISPVYSIFYPTELGVSDFIGYRLVRKDFIREMVKWRQGVIYGQWRIPESDFLNIDILVPSIEEQRKIGSFFRELDDFISLQQKKLERMQRLKAALLEKLFV